MLAAQCKDKIPAAVHVLQLCVMEVQGSQASLQAWLVSKHHPFHDAPEAAPTCNPPETNELLIREPECHSLRAVAACVGRKRAMLRAQQAVHACNPVVVAAAVPRKIDTCKIKDFSPDNAGVTRTNGSRKSWLAAEEAAVLSDNARGDSYARPSASIH